MPTAEDVSEFINDPLPAAIASLALKPPIPDHIGFRDFLMPHVEGFVLESADRTNLWGQHVNRETNLWSKGGGQRFLPDFLSASTAPSSTSSETPTSPRTSATSPSLRRSRGVWF